MTRKRSTTESGNEETKEDRQMQMVQEGLILRLRLAWIELLEFLGR